MRDRVSLTPTRPTDLVVVGAGGHARVVSDIARLMGRFTVVGFIDELDPERHETAFAGATILGGLERLAGLHRAGVRQATVAIGDCATRLRLAASLLEAGFELPVLAHPSAVCADGVALGPGTVLVAGAIVNPGARLGANVIVNTAASVDHDCTVDDGAHIACGARLAGGVHVGRGAWVGIGAVVKEKVRIGAGSVVGAGALVLKDIPQGVVAYGSPAQVIQHVPRNHSVSH
jgi:acetyltransferase EpsM